MKNEEFARQGTHHWLSLGCALLLMLSSCQKKTVTTASYKEIDVTNGGSITGVVTLSSPATVAGIDIEKDEDACGTHHANPSAPGSSTGVAGAIVYIDSISSGKPFGSQANAAIDQKQCEFEPHLQVVKSGSSILLSNSDKAIHNARFTLGEQNVLNEVEPEGVPPHEISLPGAGLFQVKCDIHPWMRGFVMMTDHPYVAITDSTGHFTLANVPPGHYTVKLWRDNWALDETRENGHVTDYKWGKDFKNQKDVDVQANTASTVNFTIP